MATRYFGGHTASMTEQLQAILPYAERFEAEDRYGDGGPLAAVEERVAELLGKPRAAFFPSGIMAQQAALRAWCDRRGSQRVAIPDISHLLVHEADGPRVLQGFEFCHLTQGAVLPTPEHLTAVPGRLGAALYELPLRDGGYLVPTFDELAAFAAACRERDVPLHLDGARIWEAQPWIGRSLADIAALADTVYVSFYKGLGGFAGACLAGPADVVDEARLWRKRMGGTLFTLFPYALAALRGLDELLPRMPELHARARELASALAERGFVVDVEQVRSVAFRAYAPRPADDVNAAAKAATEVVLPAGWRPADVPGWSYREITVDPTTLEFEVDEVADALARLLG